MPSIRIEPQKLVPAEAANQRRRSILNETPGRRGQVNFCGRIAAPRDCMEPGKIVIAGSFRVILDEEPQKAPGCALPGQQHGRRGLNCDESNLMLEFFAWQVRTKGERECVACAKGW